MTDAKALPARPPGPLLIASSCIEATRPLTLSSLKMVLWSDLLYRATSLVRPTVYLLNRRLADCRCETARFWNYLDARHPGTEFGTLSEADLRRLYHEFREARWAIDSATYGEHQRRITERGFVHPASERLIRIWKEQYGSLHVYDPGLERSVPLGKNRERTLAELRKLGCITCDGCRAGVPTLDLSAVGLPTRRLSDGSSADDALLFLLRGLLSVVGRFEQVVLVAPESAPADSLLVQGVLARSGVSTARVALQRVLASGRDANPTPEDELDCELTRALRQLGARFGARTVRLGMRLYFIGTLGRDSTGAFDLGEVETAMSRARQILSETHDVVTVEALRALLQQYVTDGGYVDPYRLAARMMAGEPGRAAPFVPLLT